MGLCVLRHCCRLLLQAFVVAQDLGIACALTPNAMLLASVPDKLAVTSFVYQMYNYFTKATVSALSKTGSLPSAVKTAGESSSVSAAASSSSPIDSVSQFNEKFTFNRMSSPVSPDVPPEKQTLSKYSRYSSKELRPMEAVEQQAADSPKQSSENTRKQPEEPQTSSVNHSTNSSLLGESTDGEQERLNQSSLPSSPVLSLHESLPNGLQISTVDKSTIVGGGESEHLKDANCSSVEKEKLYQSPESPGSHSECLELSRERAASSDDIPHGVDSPTDTVKSVLSPVRSESSNLTEQRGSPGLLRAGHSSPDIISRRTVAGDNGTETSSSPAVERGQNVRDCMLRGKWRGDRSAQCGVYERAIA